MASALEQRDGVEGQGRLIAITATVESCGVYCRWQFESMASAGMGSISPPAVVLYA
jgi:hypothetical protein